MASRPPSREESLDDRLARLGGSDLAPFARKLRDLLAGIRSDFDGDARARLEAVVAETLDRQLALQSGRERTAQALDQLAARQRELIDGLYSTLLEAVPDDGATRH